jgi:hypothetical protein
MPIGEDDRVDEEVVVSMPGCDVIYEYVCGAFVPLGIDA